MLGLKVDYVNCLTNIKGQEFNIYDNFPSFKLKVICYNFFPGQKVGPYYNKTGVEKLCFISQGKFLIKFWKNKDVEEFISSATNPLIFTFDPEIVVGYKNISRNTETVIRFYEANTLIHSFENNPDNNYNYVI